MKILQVLAAFLIIGSPALCQNKKYLGSYKVENPSFEKIIISENNGKLYGEAVGQGSSELMPTDETNTFDVAEVEGASVQFHPANNIIESLTLLMNGETVTGIRQFPELNDYSGVFEFSDSPVSKVEVTAQNGLLHINTPEFGETDLDFKGVIDEFYERQYSSDFRFIRNQDGEVTELIIDVPTQGMKMTGTKKEKKNDLTAYVGKYEILDYSVQITISEKEGQLYLESDQGSSFLSKMEKENSFETDGGDAKLEFIADPNGSFEEMIVIYQGQKMTAYRKD